MYFGAVMIRNNLNITLRHIKRKPGYAIINIVGLAVGMACCLLIGLYMKDELSFDRFHKNADRLLILGGEMGLGGRSTATPYPLGTMLETSFPEVVRVVRTVTEEASPVIRESMQLNTPQRVLLADKGFFEVFSFPLRTGDPGSVLSVPDGAVITERLARAYFGGEDPVGQTLQFRRGSDTHTVTVRGVALDPPASSTLQFDLVASLDLMNPGEQAEDDWTMFMYDTYVLLREGVNVSSFNEKLGEAVSRHFQDHPVPARRQVVRGGSAGAPTPSGPAPGAAQGGAVQPGPGSEGPRTAGPPPPAGGTSGPEPEQRELRRPPSPIFFGLPLPDYYLSDLHATEGFKGQRRYLYVFGSIALFVLLIAAINYVNLVTAQAAERAREVGVRKTLGAGRAQLAWQFLSESAVLSTIALFIALILTAALLPAFNALFDKTLTLDPRAHPGALLLLPLFVLSVGILAGIYPAFVLSHYQPVRVLRGAGTSTTPSGGQLLRKALVVLQFTISVALIIGTAIIYRQLAYVQEKSLGFNGEQVVVLNLPETWTEQMREAFEQRAQAGAGVMQASLASAVPGRFNMRQAIPPASISPQARTESEIVIFAPAFVDYDFIPTLGLRVLAGRGFSQEFLSDETRAYILNQTAVEAMGWTPSEAIGKTFRLGPPETPWGEIIGVVENFHIASLHDRIEPVVLQVKASALRPSVYVLAAKLSPEHIRDGVQYLEQTFKQMAPGEPFEYTFLDDAFNAMYRSEERLSRIFTTFATFAVLIACMGLFGLAAFTTERRTKEIGIRKVFGATVPNIVVHLTSDFLKLVLVAFIAAAPLAYFGMERWLDDFAYRIEVGYGIFVLAGILAVLIALVTVGYHSVRAALANPVNSLRYE